MFEVGQKVVCVQRRGFWYKKRPKWKDFLFGRKKVPGPKEHEIVTINAVHVTGYLGFREYAFSGFYDPGAFRPLDYDFVEPVIKMVNERPVKLN